jgi:eukaryotic-like serine/threonine-protein kinase
MRVPTRSYEDRPEPAETTSALRPIASGDARIGQVIGGKLLVEARIGSGALGVVYRAKHLHLEQPLAVKILHDRFQSDAAFRKRFHAEARSAHALDHPNVVRVVDFGEEPDGHLWLAMELLEGDELEALLETHGHLPVPRAVEIVLQVCAGLAHAHARGIVHGDVKPSNVVLVRRPDDDGEDVERVKLCDFGVALGTPHYMSPEQCLGEAPDARSDVYSCGVLLYELLVGAPPFADSDPEVVLRQHVVVEPLRPSQRRETIDERVDEIVMRALAKERDERFASMREMRAALRDLLVELGHDEPRMHPTDPPPPVRTRQISEVRVLPEGDAPDPVREFLAAHALVAGRDKSTLAGLLASGRVHEAATHAARLLARLDANPDDATAKDALSLLDDVKGLAAIADSLLAEDLVPGPYLDRMLRRAGLAAARALWTARVADEPTSERRARFVTWLIAVGEAARPVLVAALRRLAPAGGTQAHVELAEDVLLAVPPGDDRELAQIIAPYEASPAPRVAMFARQALERLNARTRGAYGT